MHAIQVAAYGGPEALAYVEVPTPEPKPGEVRVAVEAAGVNFIDVYHRSGAYTQGPGSWPLILGQEAAGVVDVIGQGVTGCKEGDRGAFA